MESVNGLDDLIQDVRKASNRSQLKQTCLTFCQQTGFEHYLLFGSVFTSLLSPPCYIIHSPGKAARLKNNGLKDIIHNCLTASTPVITGNIDKNSLIHNSIFNVLRLPTSKLLSISFPVHFPLGKFALLHISTNIHKQEIDNRVMSSLAAGNLFAREVGSSIIRLLEAALEDKPPYLSQREKECLLLASDGASPRDISNQVGLSSHTVSFYLKKARQKLHSKNIQGAVGKAMLSGNISTQIASEKIE